MLLCSPLDASTSGPPAKRSGIGKAAFPAGPCAAARPGPARPGPPSRASDTTCVELLMKGVFLGEDVPKALYLFYVAYNVRRVTFAQQYFQELRVLDDYDEKDGVAVGEVFVIKTKAEKKTKGGSSAAIQVSLVRRRLEEMRARI